MRSSTSSDPVELELASIRQQLSELRAEQQEMKQSIEELVKTFRSLAMHLGIAAEPYRKGGSDSDRGKGSDIPGFA
jgi:chromosome segregation ATPase